MTEPDADAMANHNLDSYKDEYAQLKKRIRELEKGLEFSRLETLFLSRVGLNDNGILG